MSVIIITYFIYQKSLEGTIRAPCNMELVKYNFLYKHSQGLFSMYISIIYYSNKNMIINIKKLTN